VGSVYQQTGRNTWTIKYVVDGRWITEAANTKDQGEAEKFLRSREADRDRGVPLTKGVGKITFHTAADNLKTEYRVNQRKSAADLETTIEKHLRPVFGARRMASITAADARRYANDKLKDGYKPATVCKHLAALIRMFTLAVQDGALLQQPYIAKLSLDNVRKGFFERADFDRVLAKMPVAMRDPLEFAYWTGWRLQSEVLPLQWGRHVDVAGGIVRLNAGETKNKKGRIFPYDVLPDLARLMARLRAAAKARKAICPWLFHDQGQPFTVPSGEASPAFRAAWRAATKAAGCPDRIPHDLRRTAVRNLVRAGVPEKAAMELTGHKTRTVFDRYDIVDEADLRTAVLRLASAVPSSAVARGRVIGIKRSAR
jgi:site-specific recombinase XerD